MNSIFVQIASYRDPQLIPTLNDLLANAKHPENIHITVCWQHGDEDTTEMFLDAGFDIIDFDYDDRVYGFPVIRAKKNGAKLSIIEVDYTKTKGACWARNAVQQLYSGEKYTLQLDSHHRFVEGWDVMVIDMLEGLRHKSPKPVLTAYIPSFDPDNDPAGRSKTPWRMDFDRFIPEGAIFFLPASIDDWQERDEPVPARFYSAHFCFADGSFAEEVQHDPEYFFHGEEISIGVRAFTHGYDLYHPHRIIAWHEYTRKGRTKVWDDHTTAVKKRGAIDLDWVERNNICHKRNRILFGMDGEDQSQIDFGKYGFGTARTLREFEEYAGVSFEYRGVQQKTLDKAYPPNHVPYTTAEEWRDTFVGSHDIRVLINKKVEIDLTNEDYDFWYVGAHDEQGEIFRKDLTANEIKNYLKEPGEWIDFRLIFLSNRTPTHYTVWPHSINKGWAKKLDKKVD